MAAPQPSFDGFLKASGQAEVWDDTDAKKFQQFGNWNEDKFDIKELFQGKTLPSQYNSYFETTYKKDYCQHKPASDEIVQARNAGSNLKTFPGHQPSLDPPEARRQYKTFLTTSREAYGTPS